jgi:glycerate kinase
VTVACDVTTPFLDAATVFAPQKGATGAQVALLSRRLARLADEYEDRTGVDVRALPGAGAAGGLAGGLAAIGAELEPGFDVVANAVRLDDVLEDVDLVVTGEGRLDATSFAGKVVGGVLEWTADAGVEHVAVVAGQVTPDAREEIALHAGVHLLALTDRVWQSAETFSRTALLVEEATLEAGRAVL